MITDADGFIPIDIIDSHVAIGSESIKEKDSRSLGIGEACDSDVDCGGIMSQFILSKDQSSIKCVGEDFWGRFRRSGNIPDVADLSSEIISTHGCAKIDLDKRLREIASSPIFFFADGFGGEVFVLGGMLKTGSWFINIDILLSRYSLCRLEMQVQGISDVVPPSALINLPLN